MEGKVTIPSGIPVETRDVSGRHDDRRQDVGVMRREDEEPWDENKKSKKITQQTRPRI